MKMSHILTSFMDTHMEETEARNMNWCLETWKHILEGGMYTEYLMLQTRLNSTEVANEVV